jgi:hypothetical protein
VKLSLFEEAWYTKEQEMLVIGRIAEKKLSFEVHFLKLQLDDGARRTQAVLGSEKCIDMNILLCQNPVKCGNLWARAVHPR